MYEEATECLVAMSQTIATVSLWHLSPRTRRKLATNELSVNAYPDAYGGFLFVGGTDLPEEPDLAAIFILASRANVMWLRFDTEENGVEIDGVPLYERPPLG
jgi:uroporphyrinogen-III synthase